jgi:hypothetical protein
LVNLLIIFALYAMGIFVMAAVWRRTIRGYIVVAVGAAVVLALMELYKRFLGAPGEWLGGVTLLLWAEFGAIVFVGTFIVLLPRTNRSGFECVYCGYDLRGLADQQPGVTRLSDVTCPECGMQQAPARPLPGARHGKTKSAPGQTPGGAGQEHQHGHTSDQTPGQG